MGLITTICYTLIFLFGLCGNFICMIVFMQRKLRIHKFNWYLLFQAIADFIILLLLFPFFCHKMSYFDLMAINQNLAVILKFIWKGLDLFNAYLVLMVSIDRLYAILRPTKIKMFVTYRYPWQTAVFGILLCFVVETFLFVPEFLKYHDNIENSIFTYFNLAFKISVLTIIILTLISFVLNLILACHLWRIARKPISRRREDGNRNNGPLFSEPNIVIASRNRPVSTGVKKSYLIVITLITLIDLPLYCQYFMILVLNADIEKFSWVLAHLFYACNHSATVLVYLLFHNEFRAFIWSKLSSKNKRKSTNLKKRPIKQQTSSSRSTTIITR